jgi:predicted transcriptional regulator
LTGGELKERRNAARVSQRELSLESGVHVLTIRRIEYGWEPRRKGIMTRLRRALESLVKQREAEARRKEAEERAWQEQRARGTAAVQQWDVQKMIRRREAIGLDQQELAYLAGVRAESLNRLERGKRPPARWVCMRVMDALSRAESAHREGRPVSRRQQMAERFVARQKELGVSDEEVARRAGVGVVTVANIREGSTLPFRSTMEKLLRAIGEEPAVEGLAPGLFR